MRDSTAITLTISALALAFVGIVVYLMTPSDSAPQPRLRPARRNLNEPSPSQKKKITPKPKRIPVATPQKFSGTIHYFADFEDGPQHWMRIEWTNEQTFGGSIGAVKGKDLLSYRWGSVAPKINHLLFPSTKRNPQGLFQMRDDTIIAFAYFIDGPSVPLVVKAQNLTKRALFHSTMSQTISRKWTVATIPLKNFIIDRSVKGHPEPGDWFKSLYVLAGKPDKPMNLYLDNVMVASGASAEEVAAYVRRTKQAGPSQTPTATSPRSTPRKGWTSLFNGRDLTGWTVKVPKWSVEDSALVGTGTQGNAIISKYRSLPVHFELVFTAEHKAGFLLGFYGNPPQHLHHEEDGTLRLSKRIQRGHVDLAQSARKFPPGLHHYRLVVRGSTIRAYVDDVLALSSDQGGQTKGNWDIMLFGRSNNRRVVYRDLRVRAIAPPPARAITGTQRDKITVSDKPLPPLPPGHKILRKWTFDRGLEGWNPGRARWNTEGYFQATIRPEDGTMQPYVADKVSVFTAPRRGGIRIRYRAKGTGMAHVRLFKYPTPDGTQSVVKLSPNTDGEWRSMDFPFSSFVPYPRTPLQIKPGVQPNQIDIKTDKVQPGAYLHIDEVIVYAMPEAKLKPIDLTAGLVAHWKFDEGQGTVARDSSGNGNHGTLKNGPAWVKGKLGGALRFDGVDDFVNVGNGSSLNLAGPLTIAAWIKTSSTATQVIVGGYKMADHAGYGTAVISNRVQYWSGANGAWVSGNTAVNDGAWHHVAVSVSGNTATFYLDGLADGASASNEPDFWMGDKYLGSASGGTQFLFSGLIDEVAIFDRALSAAEIQTLYERRVVIPTSAEQEPKQRAELDNILDEFARLLRGGDFKGAGQRVEASLKDKAFVADLLTLRAAATVARELENREWVIRQELETLVGKKITIQMTKGQRQGVLKSVTEEGLTLHEQRKVRGGGTIERKFTVSWDEIPSYEISRLVPSWRPNSADRKIALAYLAVFRQDNRAAEKMLAGTGAHLLAGRVRRLIEGPAPGNTEASARTSWREIERVAALQKVSARLAKETLKKLDAFAERFGQTAFARSLGDKITLTRARLQGAAQPTKKPSDKWIPIFNGRDLAGWKQLGGKSYVKDGALVLERQSRLSYKAAYSEFALECELMITGKDSAAGLIIYLPTVDTRLGTERISIKFHLDGDVTIRRRGKLLWKSGSGKFVLKQRTSVRLEHTREALRLFKEQELIGTVDLSHFPMVNGGIDFSVNARDNTIARLRNIRVRKLSR